MRHYTLMECVNLTQVVEHEPRIGAKSWSQFWYRRHSIVRCTKKYYNEQKAKTKVSFLYKWLTIMTAAYIALIVATTRNNNDKDIIGEFKLLKWQRS